MIGQQNQRVWTVRHVYWLLLTIFKVCYSVKYLPQLLRHLGLSYHKAVHLLVKRDNEARCQWIQETLPALYADYLQAGWRIFFQDEVGFQTEGTLAYTWGPKGQKTEIKNYGRHGRVNLIGVLELGSGLFYGLLTSFKVNACRFRRFLCHLKHEMPTDKLILICNNARFHKAKWLTEWLAEQTSWLHLEFLPAYSPDFNPKIRKQPPLPADMGVRTLGRWPGSSLKGGGPPTQDAADSAFLARSRHISDSPIPIRLS
ncbi:MAG: IS630 family transposase [Anaerolineae bacterium]|nr:IS630 family transposase [Anaerolineae bacterium]